MRKVLKYPIPLADYSFCVELHARHTVIKFDERHGKMYIWVDSNIKENMKLFDFFICGSGQEVPVDYYHVGTAFLHNKDLVYHLYKKEC